MTQSYERRGSTVIAVVGGLALLLFYLFSIIVMLIIDQVPYFFRSLVALAGLDDEQGELIERLATARDRAVMSLDAPGYGDSQDIWEDFHEASIACWRAGLPAWRIKLAGGEAVMQMKPYDFDSSTA